MMLHKVPGAEGPEVLLFRNDCKRETAREVVPVPTGIEIGPDRSSGAALHICDAPAVDSSIDQLSRPRFVRPSRGILHREHVDVPVQNQVPLTWRELNSADEVRSIRSWSDLPEGQPVLVQELSNKIR